MKTKKLIVVLVLVLVLAITSLATACNTSYNVTVENGTGGGSFAADSKCTVTATVPDGQVFVKWVDGEGKEVSTANPYTFTVTGNVTLKAEFEEAVAEKYTVTMGTIENGEVESDYAKTTAGTAVELTVTPDAGYELTALKVNDAEVKANGEGKYMFNMPAENVTVTATFALVEFAVTVKADIANGTVAVDKAVANMGSVVTITVTPDAEYQLVDGSLKANGVAVPMVDGAYTFTVATANVEVTAEFEVVLYTIRLSNGKIGEATSGNYAKDAVVTITADEILGSAFAGWYDVTDAENEVLVSSDAEYDYTVATNANLVAKFTKIAYTVTVTGGTADAETYYYGDMCTINATVAAGKQFMYWTINGNTNSIETDAEYKFAVKGNMTFAAVCEDDVEEIYKDWFSVDTDGNNGQGWYVEGSKVYVQYSAADYVNQQGVQPADFFGWRDEEGVIHESEEFIIESIDHDVSLTPMFKFRTNERHLYVEEKYSGPALFFDRALMGETRDDNMQSSMFSQTYNTDFYSAVESINVHFYADAAGKNELLELKMYYDFSSKNNYLSTLDDSYKICGSPKLYKEKSIAGLGGNVLGQAYFFTSQQGPRDPVFGKENSLIHMLIEKLPNFEIGRNYYLGSEIVAVEGSNAVNSEILMIETPFTAVIPSVSWAKHMVNVTNGTGSCMFGLGRFPQYTQETISVTMEVPENDTFVGWYDETGALVSTDLVYTQDPTKNLILTGRLASNQNNTYSGTVDPKLANGTITLTNATDAKAGMAVGLDIQADAGYQLVIGSITVNGQPLKYYGNNIFVMPAEDFVISATFEPIPAAPVAVA